MQYCGIPFYLSARSQCAPARAGWCPLPGYRQKTKALSVSIEHIVRFKPCLFCEEMDGYYDSKGYCPISGMLEMLV